MDRHDGRAGAPPRPPVDRRVEHRGAPAHGRERQQHVEPEHVQEEVPARGQPPQARQRRRPEDPLHAQVRRGLALHDVPQLVDVGRDAGAAPPGHAPVHEHQGHRVGPCAGQRLAVGAAPRRRRGVAGVGSRRGQRRGRRHAGGPLGVARARPLARRRRTWRATTPVTPPPTLGRPTIDVASEPTGRPSAAAARRAVRGVRARPRPRRSDGVDRGEPLVGAVAVHQHRRHAGRLQQLASPSPRATGAPSRACCSDRAADATAPMKPCST